MKILYSFFTVFLLCGTVLGQNNTTSVEQWGHENEANLYQKGYANQGYVQQVGEHHTTIDQVGNSNRADILQFQTHGTNGSLLFPPGNPGFPPPFSGEINGSLNSGSIATISQKGEQNNASVEQIGSHEAHIKQTGIHNQAEIAQQGVGGGFVFNPPGNPEVCPPAFAPCNEYNNGSFASIHQNGNNNNALIDQTNGSHFAIIEQDGNHNIGKILQFKSDNGVGVGPVISGQYHHIIQHNNFNTAEIIHNNSAVPTIVEQWGHETFVTVEHNP